MLHLKLQDVYKRQIVGLSEVIVDIVETGSTLRENGLKVLEAVSYTHLGRVSQSGFYPVISMTDGKIEKIGWLSLGGYRIGIRSPHGGYFYYAHLASYEKRCV